MHRVYKAKKKKAQHASVATKIAILTEKVFNESLTAYFIITALLYFLASTFLLTGYTIEVPRVENIPACPISSSVTTCVLCWYICGALYVVLGVSYTAIVPEEESYVSYANPPINERFLGTAIRVIPVIVRFYHCISLCQISVWIIDLLLLPECNSRSLRIIIVITCLFWWIIVWYGARSKSRLFIPPYLFDPPRSDASVLRLIQRLTRGFGP